MNIFILGTGRTGSVTFIKACSKIKNFTSGHETLAKVIGENRLSYPNNHIEADNRLVWFLGQLNEKYGDNAIYIHLKRNREQIAKSYMKRFKRGSIVYSFCEGIQMIPPEKLGYDARLKSCFDYVDAVNSNIDFFLSDKSKKITINLENIKNEFEAFWNLIQAEGDLALALQEFETNYNSSAHKKEHNYKYTIKLLLYRVWRRFQQLFLWRSNSSSTKKQ